MADRFRNVGSRVPQGSRGKRRESLWFDLVATEVTIPGASTALLILSLDAGALALRPFTIVRTYFNYHIRSDQVAAIEEYQTAVGMCVVSDQASAIGVTAVPTPFTDLGSDLWFVHSIMANQFLFLDATGSNPNSGVSKDIDSKAMRKVEDGQDVVVVLENSSISAGCVVISAGRMLIKTH